MTGPWLIFEVTVDGYSPEIFTAPTRDKARWRAFQALRNVSTRSFAEYLATSRIRRLDALPAGLDPYEGVEAQYGVRVHIGERLVLRNEGPNSGRELTVVYPGRYTSSVHAAYDGDDHAILVHPMNVRRP